MVQSDKTTLHFHLPHLGEAATPTLHLSGRTYRLECHTEETFTNAQQHNAALALMEPKDVTHFATNVITSTDVTEFCYVTTPKVPGNRLPTLEHCWFRVPVEARQLNAERRASLETATRVEPSLAFAGVKNPVRTLAVEAGVLDFTNALDMAAALVFFHPEMLTRNALPSDMILDIIKNAQGIDLLAIYLMQAVPSGPGAGGWYQEALSTTKDGAPLPPPPGFGPNWNPTQYAWSADLKASIRPPLRDALTKTKQKEALRNQCWVSLKGRTEQVLTSGQTSGDPALIALAEETSGVRWVSRLLTPQVGVETKSMLAPGDGPGNYTLSMKNSYLRWLQIGAVFRESSDDGSLGKIISGPNRIGLVSGVDTILAIPIEAAFNDFHVKIPDTAAQVEFRYGGIGTGRADWDDDGIGILLTTIFNLVIPTFGIALGAVITPFPWGSEGAEATAELVEELVEKLADIIQGMVGVQFGGADSVLTVVDELASDMMDIMAKVFETKIGPWILAQVTAEEVLDEVPFIGWVAYAISVAADVASLAETTAEISQSPATMSVLFERMMDIHVKVTHDPQDPAGWPATATHFRLSVTYKAGTTRTIEGEVPDRDVPIEQLLKDLPAGGLIRVTALLFSDTGWMAGHGETDWLVALPKGDGPMEVSLAIKERLVPLTAATQYHFDMKTKMQDDRMTWAKKSATVLKPTATADVLETTDLGEHFAALSGLTYDLAGGHLGYGWNGSGLGLPLQGTGTSAPFSGEMSVVQDIIDRRMTAPTVKRPLGGIKDAMPELIYDDTGQPTQGTAHPRHFIADPDHQNRLYLRNADPIGPGPFVANPRESFGFFYGRQVDYAVHPTGYVLALSKANAKLQRLSIQDEVVADVEAPLARMLGGKGLREGLMFDPVAVTCSTDGAVLVLQQGTGDTSGPPSILAFDIHGNPVNRFEGHKRERVPVRAEIGGIECLDISIEPKGYIYVLKYILGTEPGPKRPDNYALDLYSPDGSFLAQTTGVAAARMVVTIWRNIYTLNYEQLSGAPTLQPSLAFWIPSTPRT